MVQEEGHMEGHYVFLLQYSSRPENKNKITRGGDAGNLLFRVTNFQRLDRCIMAATLTFKILADRIILQGGLPEGGICVVELL